MSRIAGVVLGWAMYGSPALAQVAPVATETAPVESSTQPTITAGSTDSSADTAPDLDSGASGPKSTLNKVIGLADNLLMELTNEKPDIMASRRLARSLKNELERWKATVADDPVKIGPEAGRKVPSMVSIKAKPTVTGAFMSAEITLTKNLPASSEYWLAVVPARASDTAWVQGARLTPGASTRAAQLGSPRLSMSLKSFYS